MGSGFNEVTYRLRLSGAERILRRGGCAPRALLEAGVGVGAYAGLWQALAVKRWHGIDMSTEAIEDLERRFPHGRFLQLDLTSEESHVRAILGNEQFDLVTVIDVLYHIVEEAQFAAALRLLASRVATDGFLLLSDVFVDRPRRIASHVMRRPLETYENLLGEHGFRLLEREPVFAILGDPIVRDGIHPFDLAMHLSWRVLSKVVRTVPASTREGLGRFLARALVPLDSALKAAGQTPGRNLELALFRKAGHVQR
jgi:hypothetical protein